MNTKLCVREFILMLFLIGKSSLLIAQSSCDSWPPGKHMDIIQELFSCCSGFIQVDSEKLESFLTSEEADIAYDPSATPLPLC